MSLHCSKPLLQISKSSVSLCNTFAFKYLLTDTCAVEEEEDGFYMTTCAMLLREEEDDGLFQTTCLNVMHPVHVHG